MFENLTTKDNELSIGGIKCSELAHKFGTPLYVMDEDVIRNKCKLFIENFSNNKNRVAYAGKAFLTKAMCKILKEEKFYLDVVSEGELFIAHESGFPMEKIYFHGNNKSLEEIEMGLNYSIGRFVVDSFDELYTLNNLAKEKNITQKILLRLSPGIDAHTHEYIKTGGLDSKFGFSIDENKIYDTVKTIINLKNVELMGFHCHIGSQIFDLEPHIDTVNIMLDIMYKIYQNTEFLAKEMDFGGGFGIYYTDEDSPQKLDNVCKTILKTSKAKCEELNIPEPILTIEPGRSLIGETGITLYTIGAIKNVEGIRKFVSVNGGLTDNIRPALYGAKYSCMIANKAMDTDKELVTICGNSCESDMLIKNVLLPKAEKGDILAVFSTGAYGYSMSNNYNQRKKPAVIMIRNGEARLIVKRQSLDDLLLNDLG